MAEKKSPLNDAYVSALRGDTDGAIQRLSEYLNGDFFNAEAMFMLGTCLQAKGMNGLAAVIQSAAIDARKAKGQEYPEAMFNLGACYKAELHNDIAKRIWEETLKIETLPVERSRLYTNLSSLFLYAGCPEKAIPYCEAALREDPLNQGARVNLGTAYLEMGEWEPGWELWSRGTLVTGDRPPIIYARRGQPPLPEWDGSPGKTVIVWGDQGIGDEIHFANCLPDMVRVSKKVILDCHPRLEVLFRRSFPEVEVHGTRKDMTARDWVESCGAEAAVGLTDLSRFFRKHGEWDGKPYLRAPEPSGPRNREGAPAFDALWQKFASTDLVSGAWRDVDWGDLPDWSQGEFAAIFDASERAPCRIGISWAGGSKKTKTSYRSLPLMAFEPIVRALPDAEWYSLQYTENGPLDNAAREVCEFEEKTGLRLRHYPGLVECFDYDRTASFVASLDLVITVCTAVHDLAGALGVPNWVLVPSRPAWRFQVKGDSLPWYSSTRLFRQKIPMKWESVIAEIADAVRAP